MFTLVIGGSASGKSAYAEGLTAMWRGAKCYVATMEPFGAEAQARIARHQALRRGRGFETVECYVNLKTARIPPDCGVLLEDLGNLVANELYRPDGGGAEAALEGVLSLAARCRDLIVVTNEVFVGGRDYAGDTLRYLRVLSELNRRLAAQADRVVEVVCGLPNVIKGELE